MSGPLLVPSDIFINHSWIGIDPGLTMCGISIFTVRDLKLASIDAFTLNNPKLRYESEFQEEYHGERIAKLDRLGSAYREVLERTGPIVVCCESPFYNPRMPGAFGSLTETVAMLRIITNYYNPTIPFVMYSPQEVKQTFKRSGQLGKMVMKEALEQNELLRSKLIVPFELLDEHSIDAVAVGGTFLVRNINGGPQ